MSWRIYEGDAAEMLATLPAASAHCVVTSPPYFGLRDYGVLGQIGLEPTIEEYLARLVTVFRAVRRVLRPDGTLWLNLGDSFANSGKWGGHTGGKHAAALHGSPIGRNKRYTGLKAKDLIGIPWRVAFALQADGWFLRADIIYSKSNPMPESVLDRPTRSHEYLFLLSRRPRYYYDATAIASPAVDGDPRPPNGSPALARPAAGRRDSNPGLAGSVTTVNRRSVWTLPTEPFPGNHFAVMPTSLVEPCILAGTSQRGACPACGAPWTRQTSTSYMNPGARTTNGPRSTANQAITAGYEQRLEKMVETVGWAPGCRCDAGEPVPCVVLDPFAGAGTVPLVADRLGRHGIGIELNPTYVTLARARLVDDAPIFASLNAEVAG